MASCVEHFHVARQVQIKKNVSIFYTDFKKVLCIINTCIVWQACKVLRRALVNVRTSLLLSFRANALWKVMTLYVYALNSGADWTLLIWDGSLACKRKTRFKTNMRMHMIDQANLYITRRCLRRQWAARDRDHELVFSKPKHFSKAALRIHFFVWDIFCMYTLAKFS